MSIYVVCFPVMLLAWFVLELLSKCYYLLPHPSNFHSAFIVTLHTVYMVQWALKKPYVFLRTLIYLHTWFCLQ